jgi:hypothetical protein
MARDLGCEVVDPRWPTVAQMSWRLGSLLAGTGEDEVASSGMRKKVHSEIEESRSFAALRMTNKERLG